MKKLFCLILSLFILFSGFSQDGLPFITSFESYEPGDLKNWSVAQESSNVMLFANQKGILGFDGYEWKLHRLNLSPTCIKVSDSNGNIYVGCNNNYGILKEGDDTRFYFKSYYSDTLDTGIITDIYLIGNSVVFYSDQCISIHDVNDMSLIKRWYADREHSFTGFIYHKGKFYFNVEDLGLHRIESDTLFPIVTDYLTATKTILFYLPYNEDKVLVGMDDNTLQLFDGIKYFDFPVKEQKYLEDNLLSYASIISDSLLALSTYYGGVLILDFSNGKTKAILNYQNGLPDDEIYAMFTDRNDGLWLTHGFGICRVDFSIPVSNFSHYPGLQGMVTGISRNNGKLYVGTNEGLFVLDEIRNYDQKDVYYRKPDVNRKEAEKIKDEDKIPSKPVRRFLGRIIKRDDNKEDDKSSEPLLNSQTSGKNQKPLYEKRTIKVLKSVDYAFRKIEGIDHKCVQLISEDSTLIILSNSGLYSLNEDRVNELVKKRNINSVSRLGKSKYLLCGEKGLTLLFNDGDKWEIIERIASVGSQINSAILDTRNRIWAGSSNKIYCLSEEKENEFIVERTYSFQSDYSNNYFVEFVNDTIYAFTEGEILYYNPKADSFSIYTNPQKNITETKEFEFKLSAPGYPLIKTDKDWVCLNNSIMDYHEFGNILKLFENIEYIGFENKERIWISNESSGVYAIEKMRKHGNFSNFQIFITKIRNSETEYYDFDNLEFSSYEKIVYVYLNAPCYLKENSTKYQYYIEGFMKEWSDWFELPRLSVPLETGKNIIHFRAENILGEVSNERTLEITVKPPFTKSVWFYIFIVLIFAGIFTFILRIRELKLRKDNKILEEKVRQRTREIQKKKEQIEIQRDEIIRQKEEITSSITYASRIQSAMLPAKKQFSSVFKDSFIYFKPKDIVSGDFYWIASSGDIIYFAAADCTGHGVPGAFMSMLGISFLNEITGEGKNDMSAAEILEKLRIKIIMSLTSSTNEDKAFDGMDIVFCKYNKRTKVLNYSGAYNPLYYFRDNELKIYKADRMPIGYHLAMERFTDNEIKIRKGDCIYLFSDGYHDQFGGAKNKKFSPKRLQNTLSEIVGLPMERQHEMLDRKFESWKGSNEQIDDVILVGIKF